MNFHRIKKLLPMVSHDLLARNRKIVIHGIWNPRACEKNVKLSTNNLKVCNLSIDDSLND